MSRTIIAPTDLWWHAHSDGGAHHYGFADAGSEITTGQDSLDAYNTEAELLAALKAHGIELPIPSDPV
jgi:hypothetical protein